MTHVSEGHVAFAPLPAEARWAIRWVCTNNPFYAISAGLFLAGLWMSFGDPRQIEKIWALLSGLSGYTLLLAATAYVLVRFVEVWDDARTVLLLVVLMFLATSVTFDSQLVAGVVDRDPTRGMLFFVMGFLFAVLVSEALLAGIRLALPALYRGPYYLILALFFLYPIALTPLLELQKAEPHCEEIMWGLFGFSPAAGLVFLSLLPAIRRGSAYMRENGSPWPWPLYPWSVFALLALAVPARAILLCYSMHLINVRDLYESIFGFYFLVPFGLALAVLVLEMGLVSGRAGVQKTALALPLALVALSLVGHTNYSVYQQFLKAFTDRLGAGPGYLSLAAACGFYGYVALRRVPYALEFFTGALGVLAVAGPKSPVQDVLFPYQQLPLLIAAAAQLGIGIGRRDSWHCLLGSILAAAVLVLPVQADALPVRIHLALQGLMLALLLIGALFEDEPARTLRLSGALLAFLLALDMLVNPARLSEWLRDSLIDVYPLFFAALLAGYGVMLWHKTSFGVAGLILACWLGARGWQFYSAARRAVNGLDYLAISLALFVLALTISLAKAGVLSRWWALCRAKAPSTE